MPVLTAAWTIRAEVKKYCETGGQRIGEKTVDSWLVRQAPRQSDGDFGAFAGGTAEVDSSTVVTNKLARIKEAQTETPNLTGMLRINLVKFLEDFGNLFRGNSGSVVGNDKDEFGCVDVARESDCATFGGELYSIV